jgi:hypothetical protein
LVSVSTNVLSAWFFLAGLLAAPDVPRIGVIDFYGLRSVPENKIRESLGVREGDPLPASKADVEGRLEEIPGVTRARLEAVCCDREKAILYVGIEETDAPHVEFRVPPHGEVSLPSEVLDAYHEARADRKGSAGRLTEVAKRHLEVLRETLRESMDPEQRAIAAYVLGHAPAKRLVVDDLRQAILDADESVRANAMTALGDIAAQGSARVEPAWFVEILNSIVWSDRTRAASILATLTEKRNPAVLADMRDRALLALVDMARWKTPAHAQPAFLLIGRMEGLPDRDIQALWSKGDRESVIEQALKRRRAAEAEKRPEH